MQVIKRDEYTCDRTGHYFPITYDLEHELYGDVYDQFVKRYIEENTSVYRIDDKQNLAFKRYEDGMEDPIDMPSYAMYHLNRLRKTNSVTESTKLVFMDLTAEEIAASFVRFTDPQARE